MRLPGSMRFRFGYSKMQQIPHPKASPMRTFKVLVTDDVAGDALQAMSSPEPFRLDDGFDLDLYHRVAMSEP